MTNSSIEERLDRATSCRLARLASRSVDCEGLQAQLEDALGLSNKAQTRRPRGKRLPRTRSWLGVAAALVLSVAVGWVFLQSGPRSAIAAPVDLAEIHYDVIRDLSPHHAVSSIEQANEVLANQLDSFDPIPAMPGAVRSCCLHEHVGKMMACVVVESDGHLITVAVADAKDIQSPRGTATLPQDEAWIAHHVNGIQMVMNEVGGRWVCVMGETEISHLVDFASSIRF